MDLLIKRLTGMTQLIDRARPITSRRSRHSSYKNAYRYQLSCYKDTAIVPYSQTIVFTQVRQEVSHNECALTTVRV